MRTDLIPKIMLVDMNSFFASVEQQANPFFRGKPLGVCASLHETSCLIATSKEAKRLGIQTGTLIYKAKKIYPKIILVQAEPEKYREVNRGISRIFCDYTNAVEGYSIDESFLDLSQAKQNPLVIGTEIKQRIKREVGEWLTCSVGIAPNKFMAKLAADMEKPDGLSVVWRNQLPEIYKNKKFSDLWGLARGWTKRLNALGIQTPSQLLDYPVQNLLAVFGKPGFYIWQRVSGLEIDQVQTAEDLPKSFGHSWVLNFRTTDKERLKVVIMRLAEKAARRMRREGFISTGMYLSITLADGRNFHRSKKLKFVIETGHQLYEEALKIWKGWEFEENVMHIAVGFTNLQLKVTQLGLFPEKFSQLVPTLDLINDKYGEFTIRSALLTETAHFAPDAIGFGKKI
ncbi:MAG: DNA polymerase IV [Candidatus Doudnabacteria bacterium]|nr:DNA polymerase IV [Candidatus Doudnabacteria bacterium]